MSLKTAAMLGHVSFCQTTIEQESLPAQTSPASLLRPGCAQGFETLLEPQQEGRCRLIRASSAAVDTIKAVEHPGSLAALEQASAEQAAAEQGPRNRSPRVTYPPELPPSKRAERIAWPRDSADHDQAGAKQPAGDSLVRSRSDWLPQLNRAGTRL